MNLFSKIAMLLSIFLLLTNVLTAQFYYTDFSSDADWVSGGTNAGPEVWTWTDNPNSPNFEGQPAFGAPTATNGFFRFNSDGNGNNAHDVTLTGPAIDCSAQSVVFAEFQNQYAYYTTGGTTTAFLGVSTDGTNFNYYPILQDVERNDLSAAAQSEIVDISADAAGQSTVYLQFRWVGIYEYAWKIDDLFLFAENLTADNELVVNGGQFAPNYFQPASQLDAVELQVFFDNEGAMNQTNVNGVAEIIKDGVSVFSTNASLPLVEAGTIDTVISMPEEYMMEGEGVYDIKYTVVQSEDDATPTNNTITRRFEVTQNQYWKDDGIIGSATQPDGVSDIWEIGNYYYVVNGGYKATEVTFSVASNNNDHQSKTVNVKIYKVVEDQDPSDFTDEDVELVGFGEYTFTNEENFDIVSVVPEDIDTGEAGVSLEAETDYLVMIAYTPEMFAPYSTIPYYFQAATIVKTETWAPQGFGPTNTALVRMSIAPIVDVAVDTELSADNKIEIYPNPVTETLSLDIDLATVASQSTIRIVDATGKMIYTDVLENIQTKSMNIDVSKYAAGAYMLHFATENGVRTKRFVVAE